MWLRQTKKIIAWFKIWLWKFFLQNQVRIRLSGQIVSAELLTENPKTIWVRLFDGHIIKRHKIKHVCFSPPKEPLCKIPPHLRQDERIY